VFYDCAVNSVGGAAAMCDAFRDLAHVSGEYPRRELFDDEMMEAMTRNQHRPNSESVRWVLSIIN
jgi:hypothetical protein